MCFLAVWFYDICQSTHTWKRNSTLVDACTILVLQCTCWRFFVSWEGVKDRCVSAEWLFPINLRSCWSSQNHEPNPKLNTSTEWESYVRNHWPRRNREPANSSIERESSKIRQRSALDKLKREPLKSLTRSKLMTQFQIGDLNWMCNTSVEWEGSKN